MTNVPSDALERARRDASLSLPELWLRYFALGGVTTPLEVEAYLFGALRPTVHDRNLLVHVLNERFTELGRHDAVPYSDDPGTSAGQP